MPNMTRQAGSTMNEQEGMQADKNKQLNNYYVGAQIRWCFCLNSSACSIVRVSYGTWCGVHKGDGIVSQRHGSACSAAACLLDQRKRGEPAHRDCLVRDLARCVARAHPPAAAPRNTRFTPPGLGVVAVHSISCIAFWSL